MLIIKQRGTASLVDPSRKKVPYQSLMEVWGNWKLPFSRFLKSEDDRPREHRTEVESRAGYG